MNVLKAQKQAMEEHKYEIKIQVGLDADKMPESLSWEASGNDEAGVVAVTSEKGAVL